MRTYTLGWYRRFRATGETADTCLRRARALTWLYDNGSDSDDLVSLRIAEERSATGCVWIADPDWEPWDDDEARWARRNGADARILLFVVNGDPVDSLGGILTNGSDSEQWEADMAANYLDREARMDRFMREAMAL